jgi:hypothetical protein
MLQSKFEQDFLRLGAKTPFLSQLVQTFDLTSDKGEPLPDLSLRNELRFSLFWRRGDNRETIYPRKEIGLDELVKILSSPWLKSLPKIERPFITAYGTFKQRNNDSLKRFNENLVALDYDKLTPEDLNYLSMYWRLQPNTILSLISPSGNGLKVLLKAKHTFTPEALYEGLKLNKEHFVIGGVQPDLYQFVLSQPLFLPYSENPYYNPSAVCVDYGFKEAEKKGIVASGEVNIEPIPDSAQNRVNTYFINRVNYLLNSLRTRPEGEGTHQYLYSVIKRIYPYIDQQTAVLESDITARLEEIVRERYGNDSQINSLHSSIKRGREPAQSLKDLINSDPKVKCKI